MTEKFSFQFMNMKAEASGDLSVKRIYWLCLFGLITFFGMCSLLLVLKLLF